VEYVLALVVLAVLVTVVVARPWVGGEDLGGRVDERRSELEAAKEAKYREIRDVQLDHATGKLSEEDYKKTDRELRGQAIEILKRLDELD
jgi:hypothetical protein